MHAGTYIYPETFWGQQIGGGQKDIGQYAEDRKVQGVVFACAYIKREIVDKIGGLNTKFFSYFEDTDYCLQVKSVDIMWYAAEKLHLFIIKMYLQM